MVTLILYQINPFCQRLFNVLTKRWCGSTGFRKQKASSFIIFFLLSYIFSATKHNSNTDLIRIENFPSKLNAWENAIQEKKKNTIKKKQQCTLETHLQNNKSSSKFLRKSIPKNVTIENWARNPTFGNTTTTTVATHKHVMKWIIKNQSTVCNFQFPLNSQIYNLKDQCDSI